MFQELLLLIKWIELAQTMIELYLCLKENLHANVMVINYPIGAEDNFKGIIDIVSR